MSRYILDNAAEQAGQRFTSLEACLDPATIRHLEAIGVAEGWHCLEVGGGGGSIARWLSGRVGDTGRVLATDINPHFLEGSRQGNLEIRMHDIVRDDLPVGEFDLVHARLVLIHLPERGQVVERLVAALKPGGWIVLDEFDVERTPLTVHADRPAQALVEKVESALYRVFEEAGADLGWGHKVFGVFREAKLADVGAEAAAWMWPGGSPGSHLRRANCDQLEAAMLASGAVTRADVDAYRGLLTDPGVSFPSYCLISTWGRRPL
jgi:SAM-dependent methyltransferase